MQSVSVSNRIFSADAMRTCAIVMVVCLHAAAESVYRFSSGGVTQWWTANLLDSISRAGVPLFVMVSGMLLLDPQKSERLSTFFAKRIRRVVLPLIIWGVVYLMWKWLLGQAPWSWRHAVAALVQGSTYYHLGFLYMLLGLYLATPILRVYTRNASLRDLLYLVSVWLIAAAASPLALKFLHIQVGIQFVVATGFVGYFVLGHLLRAIHLRRRQIPVALFLVTALWGVTAVGTYALTLGSQGVLDEFLYGYLSPNVILMSSGCFLVLNSLSAPGSPHPRSRFARRAILLVSSCSFGIYLMHPIALEVLSSGMLGVTLSGKSVHPLLGVPLTTLVTLLGCLAVVLALRRLPGIRVLLVPK